MNNLNDQPRGGTLCLSNAGLAVGGTSTGIAIAAPNGAGVDFCIKGVSYHKADAATAAITAATVQAVATTCLYVIALNSSGTVSSIKGTEVLSAELTSEEEFLFYPQVDDDVCPIGAVKVVTDATHTFTAGTTAFDATGITDTYINLFAMPVEGSSS